MLFTAVKRFAASWRPLHIEDGTMRHALWFSFADGIFAVAMIALVETHGVAALLSLGASKFEIAMLGSIPLLFSALIQLLTPLIAVLMTSRKHVVMGAVIGQCVCLLLVASCGYVGGVVAPLLFVLFYALYAMSGSVGVGVWSSWMGDLIPQDIRGRYFAWRSRYFSIAQVVIGISSGYLVQQISGGLPTWQIFAVIYFVATAFRVGSVICVAKQHEPPLTFQPVARDFTYAAFLRKAPSSNFSRFVIFVALIHGTAALSGPFFSVYFLTHLHLPYGTFAFVVNAHLIGTLIMLPFWGRIADHYGNWLVVRVTTIGAALIPLPYLFLTSPVWLWLLGFAAGALWSAFGLATFNYVLDAVTPQRRIRCAAYMGTTVGFSVCAFGLLGGWLAMRVHPLLAWSSGYQTLFAISAALRLSVVGLFLGFGLIREIRDVQPVALSRIFDAFPGVRVPIDFARYTYRVLRRI
jgi:MFS family permease